MEDSGPEVGIGKLTLLHFPTNKENADRNPVLENRDYAADYMAHGHIK